jgi:hypothetical protein
MRLKGRSDRLSWTVILIAFLFSQGAPPSAADLPAVPTASLSSTAPATEPLPPTTNPRLLDRPLESAAPAQTPAENAVDNPVLPPLGFTGPSGVMPSETQESEDFVPVEDRWREGFPFWDRYGWKFPIGLDYPYKLGAWWDPYNQNVLKGDYPIIGDHTFLNLTASSTSLLEPREIPTSAVSFVSTNRPNENEFFGRPNQFLFEQYFALSIDLFHGDAAFKPVDWRIRITPVYNINTFDVNEVAIVSPDVRKGTSRNRGFVTLEEYFVESKLADLSPNYDFVSVRVGSQPFTSDFRGFIFSDTNRAVRIFGTLFSNQDQFNLVYFRPAEKNTDSELNSFQDRGQNIVIANYYHQDFIWPGYTAQASVHYDNDPASMHYDQNGFLVRPDPVGVAKPHEVDAVYLGWTGDGHINNVNITHAFYWVLGHDSLNPLANAKQEIDAQMAAVELSYDRDWARFRTSFLFASGDENPNNRHATGFDSIMDNPNFAGGDFSYWQRQAIPLFGVNLVNRESLLPDLRSSKLEGQSNFVNPGLFLLNLGVDFDLTPKLRLINNVNFLWFDKVQPLQTFVFQQEIRHFIGVDISSGVEYRPLLNNNIILRSGVATLVPGAGFQDLYNRLNGSVNPLVDGFVELKLQY